MFKKHRDPEQCRVVEVSRKGVLLKHSHVLRHGTKVQIALAYNRDSNVTRLVRRWARVARQTANGCALVFTDLPRKPSDCQKVTVPR